MSESASGDKNNSNERLRMSVCLITVMYARASRDCRNKYHLKKESISVTLCVHKYAW
jgi:hypothetical protein